MHESHRSVPRPEKPGTRRHRSHIAESIAQSRMTLLINMFIEAVCALILLVGFLYFVRFLFFWRSNMNDQYFTFFLGAIILLCVGWFAYITMKLRSHYRLYKAAGRARRVAEEEEHCS